jgi:hypothetical protein
MLAEPKDVGGLVGRPQLTTPKEINAVTPSCLRILSPVDFTENPLAALEYTLP